MKKICFFLLVICLLTETACEKNKTIDNETIDNEAIDHEIIDHEIIGKWGLIAQGYYDSYNNRNIVINPVENSERYIEFFSNGKMKGEIRVGEEVAYKINEQLLYENYTDERGTFIYKYELSNDTLTLDCIHGNIPDIPNPILINIYQRINE